MGLVFQKLHKTENTVSVPNNLLYLQIVLNTLTQCFSTWGRDPVGSFAIFLRVARACDKNIHNYF